MLDFLVRLFYGRWIRVLEYANEDYNRLRAVQGLPPLNNIGRWVYESEKPDATAS